ncbi:MAG: GAF domain-containing protein [Chloroflexi bacterium]|nr:GAF domain-containing protein [Chloroflexota bacterium]
MALLTNLSLQKRLGLIVLAGSILGLTLVSWLGIQAVNESVQRTLEERLMVARVIASHIDENIAHVIVHLRNTANFGGQVANDEEFKKMAASLRGRLSESGMQVQNVLLLDGNGVVVAVEPEDTRTIGTDLSSQPEVAKALTTGQATVSSLLFSPITNVPVVLVSVPVLTQDDTTIGLLSIAMDVEQSNVGTFGRAVTIGRTGYMEIVDSNGIVLARTSPARPPSPFEQSDHPGKFAMLIARGTETVGVCHRCHEAKATLERRRDMLAFAPLSMASWGVAIRQAEEEALAPTMQLRQKLVLLGVTIIAITFLLLWITVQGIVRPIKTLTTATKRVAAGDFRAATPSKRKDEIGQLSAAFNAMTQDLARSRNDLTKSRDELVLRNRELSALNLISSAVNQSLELEKVLESAMRNIHELTETTAGCVFLRDSGSSSLKLVTSAGSSRAFQCQEAASPTASCACHQVLRHGRTLMVNDISQCPLLGENTEMEERLGYFVCVPLKARDRTLGIMNIGGNGRRPFTENDFGILDSIAYHIGLAIENSSLYEEARQKEKLRGQLLTAVINAQEKERKRIARELHDEYGQSLTALKVSIESLESLLTPRQTRLKEKLRLTASLVVNALEDLRRLTLDLRPYALDELGLNAAIRAYAQRHLEPLDIKVAFETSGMGQRLGTEVETIVFRIIQEAIHNIIRHAKAHNVTILLAAQEGKVAITVEDDGAGFDVETVFKTKVGTQSLGLLGIQERATLLGGSFTIQSQAGRGTRLYVEIPVAGAPLSSSLAQTRS